MSTSDHEVNMMRELGRKAAVSLARAPERMGGTQGVAREFARVTKVYSDGRVDVDKGSAAYPMPMLGIRTTTACLAVEVGDTVVVDTYAHVPVATGVMATADNRHYVKSSRVVSGSKVVSVENSDFVYVFSPKEVEAIAESVGANPDYPTFSACNGDWDAWHGHITSTAIQAQTCIAFLSEFVTATLRVNWSLAFVPED